MHSVSRDQDLASIRAVESAYDAAWDAGDIESLLNCFADDAVVVNPRGEVAVGLNEIRHILGAFLRGPAKGSTHKSTLVRVAFVTSDVAIVDGEAELKPSRVSGADTTALTHRFTDVVVRRHNKWVIAHIRAQGAASWTPETQG
jgi:uncharacterized protein (TIGR02246 family)